MDLALLKCYAISMLGTPYFYGGDDPISGMDCSRARSVTPVDLALLKCYAISMLGTPYFYGGDDPISGMDCSGLVSEILRASGIVPWNFRQSAHGIFERFQATAPWGVCELGALSFYGTDTRITHVGFCLDSETMIEAGGGGPGTDSPEEQSAQNAFARLRPVRYRSDFLCVLKPYYGRRL